MSLPFKIVIKRDFIVLSILLTLCFITLDLFYGNIISQNYQYMGFIDDFNIAKFIIIKIVFLSLLILSYHLYSKSKFLYIVYLFLIFFFYIPNSIVFAFSNVDFPPFVANTFFVSFFLITPHLKFNFSKIAIPQNSKTLFLILISVVFLLPILATFKLDINLKTLLLSEIYSTRDVFSEKLSGLLGYLYNILAKTIIPCALVYFLIKKRMVIVIVLFSILMYLFLISGNKLVYFTTLLVLFFYYFGKDFSAKAIYFFSLILIVFTLLPIIDSFYFGTTFLTGTIVNRTFFVPAILTHFYFDYFKDVPFYFAESSGFNLFFSSPYDTQVAFLISKLYWNGSTSFANNGIVSDGFMNLGYFGVVAFSIIFTLLFSFFNSINLNRGYFGIYFSYIFLALSVPLLSSFITGGIVLFIILSLYILKENIKIKTLTN